jgi:hypothetical protein
MMQILSEQANQFATLSGILGGLTLAVIVELFLTDDKRKLATTMTLVFCLATFMFLVSMVTNMILVIAAAELKETAHAALVPLLLTAGLVTFGGVEALLVGLGLAGWLHSKYVGVVTTVFALIATIVIVSALVYVVTLV